MKLHDFHVSRFFVLQCTTLFNSSFVFAAQMANFDLFHALLVHVVFAEILLNIHVD